MKALVQVAHGRLVHLEELAADRPVEFDDEHEDSRNSDREGAGRRQRATSRKSAATPHDGEREDRNRCERVKDGGR